MKSKELKLEEQLIEINDGLELCDCCSREETKGKVKTIKGKKYCWECLNVIGDEL